MRRVVIAFLLSACSERIPPPPEVFGVEPAAVENHAPSLVVIRGAAFHQRVHTDLSAGKSWAEHVEVELVSELCDLELDDVERIDATELRVILPVAAPACHYRISVITAYGQSNDDVVLDVVETCDDADGDGVCAALDRCVDRDGDGVGDPAYDNSECATAVADTNDDDANVCADTDGDGCDDCASGTWDVLNDGVDLDGDGACAAGDCDDTVATGDGCVSGCGTFYADLDGDGHGDADAVTVACVAPGGMVTVADDCDDDLLACGAGCFPGNTDPDIIDGYNQDCDGFVDEDDVVPPVITVLGDSPTTTAQGQLYTDAGATAVDNVDGDITGAIVVSGTVDTSVAGTYTLYYDVSDAAGNAAVQQSRTVHVADLIAPVITLLGVDPVTVGIDDLYADAGATALDDIDGDLTGAIAVGGSVDTSIVGSYVLTYDVIDAAGNPATQVTRTVHVVENVPPVITLLGDEQVIHIDGTAYVDAGASAFDDVDGDITGDIVVGGAVDTETVGVYLLTYDVSDAAGNAAAQVTRTVNVIFDCSSGVISSRRLSANGQPFGSGTAFVVCSFRQLEEVGTGPGTTDLAATYVLGTDIDAVETGDSGYNGGLGWPPIGSCGAGACGDADDAPFTGEFFGAGYTISNVTIDDPGREAAGLFGAVDDGTIVDLGVSNLWIHANTRVGGVIGSLVRGTVEGCYAEGTLGADDSYAGGVVGYLGLGGTVSRSWADVAIVAAYRGGGLVGANASGFIVDCFAIAIVSAGRYSGGLVGLDINGTMRRSHAVGLVKAERAGGGLIGQSSGPGTILVDCFVSVEVTADTDQDFEIGYIIGKAYGYDATGVYYDSSRPITNGGGAFTTGIGAPVDVGGTAPADYFFDRSNPPLSSWDFVEIWREVVGDYPVLR